MKTKLFFSLFFVFLFSLVPVAAAQANMMTSEMEGEPRYRGQINHGKISEIGVKQFTIKQADGGFYTYRVNLRTRYQGPGYGQPDFFSLEIGQSVIVIAGRDRDGLLARFVFIAPRNFDPVKWLGVRVRGEVLEIDFERSTFTIKTPSDQEIVFRVGSATRFIGKASGLEEMEVGWKLGVFGGEREDGSITATIVITSLPKRHIRLVGKVQEVNVDKSSITMTTRRGKEVIIVTNEDTQFHSKKELITDFESLEPDMIVVVTALIQGDETHLALHVAMAFPEDLPKFKITATGKLVGLEDDMITIETRNGASLFFEVNDQTKFCSRDGAVDSIEDLAEGMILFIGADEGTDGNNVARMVFALKRLKD
jgi:hypothetical protein